MCILTINVRETDRDLIKGLPDRQTDILTFLQSIIRTERRKKEMKSNKI